MAHNTTIKERRKKTGAEHIKEGKPWRFHFVIDNDVAKKILEEIEDSETGVEIGVLLNSKLRKAYGIKKPKRPKRVRAAA